MIFSEDFSGVDFPPIEWSIVGDGQENWESSESNSAGGSTPEAKLTGLPGFDGNSKLLTPEMTTSAYDEVILQFNHFVCNYGGDYTISIETTSDGANCSEVWSVEIDGSINPEIVFVSIDNGDVGSDNFQIAITFNGNSSNIFSWHLDNILLNESLDFDAEATNILVPSMAADNDNIAPIGVLTNKGSETISFVVRAEIIDEALTVVYTENRTVTDLLSFEREVLTFPSWTSTEGVYTVNLSTSMAGDENPENDLVSSSMEILEGVIFKQPLYEEYTSSTCGPCALQNSALDAVLAANPITHSLIKYQMDWPGSGDPYYIPDCGTRVDYYENVAAPKLFINSNAQWVGGLSQAIYDSYGETEFNNVLMKMLPDANGTTLDALTTGNTVAITESYNMNETFMEEPNDLAVIVFVQDDNDKSILQSEMMDISFITGIETKPLLKNTVKLSPNPASDRFYVAADEELKQLCLYSSFGQFVLKEQIHQQKNVTVLLENLPSGIYLVKIESENEIFVRRIVVH